MTERAAFAASNLNAPYTLTLENGGATSAVVTLNSIELFGPSDFNANTPRVLEKSVTLRASNELTVEVRGDPGSGITLRITGADNDLPTIVATVTPVPNAAGWNNTPVTVSFTCGDATSPIASCSSPVEVAAEGPSVVTGTAVDAAGNSATTSVSVNIDTLEPTLEAKIPIDANNVTNASTIRITGRAFDNDRIDSVKVNDLEVSLNGDEFSADVALVAGANPLAIVATDRAGNESRIERNVIRFVIPVVTFSEPADLAVVRAAAIDVHGSVSVPVASVDVNGVAATVSGTTFVARNVPLAQGRTVITATATDADGHAGSASLLLYRDSIPPRVVLRSPEDGATVIESSIDVAGMVDDIVVGTVNAGQVRVTVNGANAEVSNRAFVARNVALAPGLNTLTIVATDQGGNAVTLTSRVTFDAAAGQARIVAVSGDDQTATIGATLPAPLTVRLVNSSGTPATGRPVTFEVLENNGTLAAGDVAGRTLVTSVTDAQGVASAVWTLGMRAGAGNNRVAARASGFAGSIEFNAIALMGAPAMIVVDSGNNQFGIADAPLPRPLVAVVVDAGSNRIVNANVTFSVVSGRGSFDGQNSVTIRTDSDGRAIATPTLGATGTNLFRASVTGVDKAASFVAVGKIAGLPDATRISGVILDNTDLPIPGVSVRIDGTTLVAQTDAQGQFQIASAPVGYVKLLVDGSTTQRPGTWPTLEYAMYTIPGANNTLEMPIYLLPIDVRRGLFVDEVTGGTLTLPELPGFALTVKPGSATFPGGGRTGTVSVTVVHADKMPMAPGFGQQPRFIVTIQPPGVHFDPPAAIAFPNVDGLAPGQVTELYSFDHDLGQFVAIGTGSVSSDGSVVRSDPGVGIIKGGWHCGGDPAANGTTADCPDCQICQNDTCVADPNQFCNSCGSPAGKACDKNGSCQTGLALLSIPEVCQNVAVGYVYANALGLPVLCANQGKTCSVGARYNITTVTHSCDSISFQGGQLTETITVTNSTCGPHGPPVTGSAPIGANNAINTVDDFFYCDTPAAMPASCSITMQQELYVGSCHVSTHTITISITNSGSGCSGSVTRT